jgi:hypothetical protein
LLGGDGVFVPDGKCFDVAVDHGFFGERGFLVGIEDMDSVVKTLGDAAPNARVFWGTGRGNYLRNAFYRPLFNKIFLPFVNTE